MKIGNHTNIVKVNTLAKSAGTCISSLLKNGLLKSIQLMKHEKKTLKKVNNATLERKKVHSKKRMKALSNVAVINTKNKENIWYLDIAAVVHMTCDLSLYITLNLDYQTVDIEIADSTILKIQDAKTINLHILVGNEHMQIELSNVYYLFELNTNLISFGVLEEKGYVFHAVNALLQIKDKKNDIVLEFIRENTMYLL